MKAKFQKIEKSKIEKSKVQKPKVVLVRPIETLELNQAWFTVFEDIRAKYKLTYEKFVKNTGIGTSKGYYGDFKSNRRLITLNHIIKVQAYFNIQLI